MDLGQLVPWVLGIIGMTWGAIAFNSKQRAEADKIKAERDKLIAQAELKEVEASGEARKAEAETVKNLIIANQQFADLLRQKEARDEANYKVLRGVTDDNARTVMGHVDYHAKKILEEIGNIPNRLNVASTDVIQGIAAEIGMVMARELTMQGAKRKLHPFPDPDNAHWRLEFVKPVAAEVVMYKDTQFHDTMRLNKPCSAIKQEGEWLWIVEGAVPGWIAVEKTEDGRACWGWVYSNYIKFGKDALVPAPA